MHRHMTNKQRNIMYQIEKPPLCTMQVQSISDELLLYDDFADDRPPGTVIGSVSKNGHQRLGKDIEGVLSIDNAALRIAPLIDVGFGRAGIAYGPFARQPGLVFAVYMLNGHNTSQAEPLSDTFRHRINLWIRGSEADPRWQRIVYWLRNARFRRTLRQFRWWKRAAKGERPVPLLDENLAVGWFSTAVVSDPRQDGNGFIMHALGPENGELWAGKASNRTRSLRGVQNVPVYYVAVVRGQGVVYYVSSIEGAAGLSSYPWLQPVAVDQDLLSANLYVAVQQGVLGQIGFRLDTRIYGVRVAQLAGYESWCGGAHAADGLIADNVHAGTVAEIGGVWQVWAAQSGCVSSVAYPETVRLAVLDPGAPSGLIHAMVAIENGSAAKVGLLWRCRDERNHWRLELSERACSIVLITEGDYQIIASREYTISGNVFLRRLQILDNGSRFMAYVDGEPLSDTWISDLRLEGATKVGVLLDFPVEGAASIRSFEAHPQRIRLPSILDMGAPWLRKGTQVVVADDFTGTKGDLDGRMTPVGGKRWNRIIGKGMIEVSGMGSACVQASIHEPCPGRTAYCVDWPHPEFADIEVIITPPGTQAGEKNRTMAGFILYQDSRNYVTLNAYRSDYYPAGSISTFFKFRGFEDVYDAIWSNVADRVYYGKPLRLRLCSDGERYVVFINDETVLYRAFRDVYFDVDRLQIRKVGIIANWEFGTDTGSKFEQFRLRV